MASTLDDYIRTIDEVTRRDRTERVAELLALGEPSGGRMLFGDCLTAFREAQSSYVGGNDLAAILAVQACLEKLLCGFLHTCDLAAESGSFAALLKQVRDRNVIAEAEYVVFDRVRRRRNPNAHYRDVNHPEHSLRRAMTTGEDPDDALHADAQSAVHELIRLVNRPPFAIGPLMLPFSEHAVLPPLNPDQLALRI